MIKIGLLIDSLIIKKWQYEILNHIKSQPELKLAILIVREKASNFPTESSLIYRASQALDRKIFSVMNDIFSNVDIKEYSERIPLMYVDGKERKFSYHFPQEKIEEIRNLDLDLLIRFGFGILKGGILKVPKNGVWSLHHGDNSINRGGPPAFWEVANREKVTGITLQKLSEDLDGGQVLKKSYIKTDMTSFYRNKNQAFWAGVELFKLALNDLEKGILKNSEENGDFCLDIYSHPLYKDPDNWISLKIMLEFWGRRLNETYKEHVKTPQWYLLYRFKNNQNIEKSIFRYKTLFPPKGHDWADPFVFKKNEHFYVFFEEMQISTKKGHISYLEFDHRGSLMMTEPIKVLEEPYHLSYPYVLDEDNDFYLLPESADAGELWLYKAEQFPVKWVKYKPLFKNKAIYDASLFYHDDYWYLFGTEKLSEGGSRDQYLHIYYSRNLSNPEWRAHPQNPVSLDVRGARPAGKIFKKGNKIFRPAQIGAPKYGYGIQLNEINLLSPTEFSETKVEEILPEWENKLLATHTFNFVDGFSIIDAQGEI